jgi:hypothetical protein
MTLSKGKFVGMEIGLGLKMFLSYLCYKKKGCNHKCLLPMDGYGYNGTL